MLRPPLGVKLTENDLSTVIAVAAVMDVVKEETARGFTNQTVFHHGLTDIEGRVITVNGVKYSIGFSSDPETYEALVCTVHACVVVCTHVALFAD